MPFNTEQLAYAGRAAIDYYLKNSPVDQINIAHPLLKKLTAGKKEWGGGLQYVVEQLRYSNDSNFQSYFGDQQVSYNRKRTIQQAKFTWGAFHDGFGLNEDEMAQNGIIMTDDKNAVASDAEKVQLTNLLQENIETLKLGFQVGLDLMLHRDGTQSATDIPGLANLVSLDPSSSLVVGTLNQQTYPWWRNYAKTDILQANLVQEMEIGWREQTRYGGFAPDFYLAGSDFIDAYAAAAGQTINRQIFNGGNLKGGVTLDASRAGSVSPGEPSSTGLFHKGVEIMWDPVFETLDALDNPAIPWSKRCYALNTKFLSLRPIKGHWMVSRKPPRVYDRYVQYWALTAKTAFSVSKRNAQAVYSIY